MAEDWTEKYRPKKLSDVIGNPSAVKELEDWAGSWSKGIPKKRAVVLIGPPGTGKTSSAEALAGTMSWDIIEMNASDQRTEAAIKEVALRGSHSNSLGMDGEYKGSREGRKKLIVLDEADNLFGKTDRGGLGAINELIKTTKQPVILIVNDFYALSRKSSTVKNDTIQITFRRPTARSIAGVLKKIAAAEGIKADDEAIMKIAENANGDMRAGVRDLEAFSHGKSVIDASAVEGLQERFVQKDMYDVLDRMFRKNDPFGSRKTLMDADVDPETAILWIDENLPREYKEPGDLVRGYEKLSKADIYLGRVHRRQYYRMWAYAGDMMTAGVSMARMSNKVSHDRFMFPSYLSKMSRSRSSRELKSSLSYKIAKFQHTSTKRVETDILGPLKELSTNDPEIRMMLVKEVGLEPEELGFLMDMKMDSKIVKETFHAATQQRKPVAQSVPEKTEKPPVKVQEKVPEKIEKPLAKPVQETAEKKPRNIFDF
jgi:replication factor C large subunit